MPEDDGDKKIDGELQSRPSMQSSPDPPRNQNPPSPPANSDPDNNQATENKLERIAHGERWLIVIGIAAILVNIGLGVIYYQQLTKMKAATEASTRVVDLAQETLAYNSSQFDRAMRQTISQTVASITAANAAKDSADIARESLHTSERAYIVTTLSVDNGIRLIVLLFGELFIGVRVCTMSTLDELPQLLSPFTNSPLRERFSV